MKIAALTFLILAVTCEGSGPADPDFAVEVTVSAGETVSAGDVRVRFAELLEESRCPSTVICVWQGNGKIRVEITNHRATSSVQLNTAGDPSFPREATALGVRVRLEELQPYPQDTGPHDPSRYRARLLVSSE